MPFENLAAKIKEEASAPQIEQEGGTDAPSSASPIEASEPANDDEVWVKRLIDRLRQGRYPKHPLLVDGKYIIHDFRKCAKTHIRYYREATGAAQRKNEHEVASKKKVMNGIKRLIELTEEQEEA